MPLHVLPRFILSYLKRSQYLVALNICSQKNPLNNGNFFSLNQFNNFKNSCLMPPKHLTFILMSINNIYQLLLPWNHHQDLFYWFVLIKCEQFITGIFLFYYLKLYWCLKKLIYFLNKQSKSINKYVYNVTESLMQKAKCHSWLLMFS